MNTNIYYPNLIRNDQNKYRLNLVIYDLLNEVNNITKCCKNGSYTLVLHKHLGDFIILLNLNLLNDSTLSLFLTALRAYVSINWIARCYFIKSESEDERTN